MLEGSNAEVLGEVLGRVLVLTKLLIHLENQRHQIFIFDEEITRSDGFFVALDAS
ncbi:hypothetical protein D3C80_1939780 [compost metagenome]